MGFYAMYLYIVPWFFQRYKGHRAIGTRGKMGINGGLYVIRSVLLLAHFFERSLLFYNRCVGRVGGRTFFRL